MVDPYRMVFVNLIASCVVLIGTIFYRYIYPKKKINLFILLLVISILPIISIFRVGTYESGDFNIHIYRIISFYDSLKEGTLMPSWAGELNATYGNPLFIFNYSLPYYIVSFFHFIGLSFISSMKIYLGLSLYLSGVFMYLWIKKLILSNLAAFTAAIFYLFNPYHLISVHFRATLGESTIFTLAPLLLLFITLFTKEEKLIYLILTALMCQLLFFAHPMVALTIFGVSILFLFSMLSIKKRLKNTLFLITALIFGAVISMYAWLPFILFSSYMPPVPGGITWQFDSISQLLYSPWRFGFLFQGHQGELSYLIGYTQVFVVIISVILLLRNKFPKKIKVNLIFWLLIVFAVLFFMTSFSKVIWEKFPFLMMLESNRLLLPIGFSTSVIAGYLAFYFSKKNKGEIFIYALLFITTAYTILNWGHRRVIPETNDSILRKNVWISTVTEGTTAYFLNNKWADINHFWFTKIPRQHLQIMKGEARIVEIKRTSTSHKYLVHAKTSLVIQENTLYYPGWSLKSNSDFISIYPGKKGVINARLPKGEQKVELYYQDIPLYALSKAISALAFLSLLFLIISYYLRHFFFPAT
ncbi:6-pyruvoyl-tetrahydropterin synthase-related protein [Patescibacteria group bacterium]|nr:6-pyruvoyl-tetrahydropterin synthase-related protein [Patescibacteria group bacterium]